MSPDPIREKTSGTDIMATALMRNTKAIKNLDDVLGAVAVAPLTAAKKIISAIKDIETTRLAVEKTKADPFKPIRDQVGRLRDMMVDDQKVVLSIVKDHRKITASLDEAVSRLSDLEVELDLNPLNDALMGFKGILEGLDKAIKTNKAIRIPLEDDRVKVKLSAEDLKILTKAFAKSGGEMWQQRDTEMKLADGEGNKITSEVISKGKRALHTINASDLITEKYDSIALTYVASGNGEGEIETAIYKLSGVTKATLTLAYNSDNKITTVTKS